MASQPELGLGLLLQAGGWRACSCRARAEGLSLGLLTQATRLPCVWKTRGAKSTAKATTTHTKWRPSLPLQRVVSRHGKEDIVPCHIRIR